ncbi:MAG TPA: hypothetical protein GXX23_07610 [Firmicutes bacterium]|nr:hypothetical protein [Candidatus Fermentithermobacillaceae bacterium]
MGGRETIKGCNFQHACAMEKALSLLESSDNPRLVLEGSADVVDYEITVDNRVVEVGQIKTRDEPYQWTPGEIDLIMDRLIRDRPDSDRFVFVTDGSAGKDVRALKEVVDSVSIHKTIGPEQEQFLMAKFPRIALCELTSILPRLRIKTRHPGTEDTLGRVKYRLHQMGLNGDLGAESLFLKVALTSEASIPSKRVLTQSDIAEAVGARWPMEPCLDEWLAEYRSALTMELGKSETISLDYSLHSDSSDPDLFGEIGMRFVVNNGANNDRRLSLKDVIAEERHLVIEGGPGCGKTTSLRLAAQELLGTARLIIIAPASVYRGEPMEEFLAGSVSRLIPVVRQDPGFVGLLRQGSVVIILDGLDECPSDYQDHLFREVRRVAWGYHGTRVIASSRDPTHGRRLGFQQATVLPLDESRVRALLRLDGDADTDLFDQLRKNIGSFLGTPLAVKMVSALLMTRQELPRNRSELYREFLRVLFERDNAKKPSGLSFDAMFRVGSRIASRLQDKDEVTVSWSRFLDICDDIREELASEQKFDTHSMSAEALAEKTSLSSWMRRDYTTVSFVHTSVQEFLASDRLSFEAVRQLAPNPRSHEMVAFWISSCSPDLVEGFLKQLLPVNLELIDKCWRNGTQVPILSLADYLACFRDALSVISRVHLPSVFDGREISVYGSIQGEYMAYAVIPGGTASGVLSTSELANRVQSKGYMRVRKAGSMLGTPPTIAAYREMLDLLEGAIGDMEAALDPEDGPLPPDSPGHAQITDAEFIQYLTAANADFDTIAPSVAPTLVFRMRRPGDLEGYFAEENSRRVFVCHDSDRGAGPKVVSEMMEAKQWGNRRLDMHFVLGQNLRRYVFSWIEDEIKRLLFGYGEKDRWRK